MRSLKPEPLRLRAEAAADYDVISACLQDALMPLSEMIYLAEEKRFVAVFDRFTWEACAPGNAPRPRFVVQAALRFESVSAVRLHGVDQTASTELLELLTIVPESGGVRLMFAGGGALRLEGESLTCFVEDLSDPRPAVLAPVHDDPLPGEDLS
jgi:hypothetical protein